MARTPKDPSAPRKPRSPAKPKKVYVVLQVVDENGQPTMFDKDRINVLGFETSADAVLDKTESGEYPGAFFKRGLIHPRTVEAASE